MTLTYLINNTGTNDGEQQLGYTSYSMGNNLRSSSTQQYEDSQTIDNLDNLTVGDDTAPVDATHNTMSTRGQFFGDQNMRALNIRYGTHRIIKDLIDENPVDINDVTGLYQDRFEGYTNPAQTGGPTAEDLQNNTGIFTGVQSLGGVVQSLGGNTNSSSSYIHTAKNIPDLTGLYTDRFDDETYYD